MQTLQRPIPHVNNPEDRKPQAYRITSQVLDRTIFASDSATLPIDALRALYHEVYCDRHSMLRQVDDYAAQLDQANNEDDETKAYLESKHHRVSKKLYVYNVFYKLIKREVNLRTSLNQVSRINVIIQAKQVGLNDAQINALLDPDNAIQKIFAISDYSASPARRKAITVADRLESLRQQMVMAEMVSLLSKEFDHPELVEIRQEARANADKAIDWQQVESVLIDHLPDGNGLLEP